MTIDTMIPKLTLRQTASVYTLGLVFILTLGTFASIALVLSSLWLLMQLAVLVLASLVECCSSIGATFHAADPTVRLLVLVVVGFLLYQACKRVRRVHA